jgi:hypothetical protein
VPGKENAGPRYEREPGKGNQMSKDVMDRIAVRKKNATAPNQTETWQDWPPEIDVAAIVRRCRLRICEQYKQHGDGHALVAIACSAVVLEAHIVAGSLIPSALNQLREVSDNLGTTKRCGVDVVETCIGVGAALFAELEEVYARRNERVAA